MAEVERDTIMITVHSAARQDQVDEAAAVLAAVLREQFGFMFDYEVVE